MRTVFGDGQRLGFRHVEYLPCGVTGGHRLVQGRAARRARLWEMIDRGVGRFGPAQCSARMTFLPAGLLAGPFAKAADAGGLLRQTIAGGRFPAVAAVQPELTFQFADAGL